jgi:flagellar biosynthesis GTPase FlhF
MEDYDAKVDGEEKQEEEKQEADENEEEEEEEEEEEADENEEEEEDEEEEEEEEEEKQEDNGYKTEQPRVKYLKKIRRLLDAVQRPGEVATGGAVEDMTLPGLSVQGLGVLSLPLPAEQLKALKRLCSKAPFGRKEKTIVDPKVRDTWQLEPHQLTIGNPGWAAMLERTVSKVGQDLGCDQAIEAQLYKLLLYEPGQHFAPHRDSEKVDGQSFNR